MLIIFFEPTQNSSKWNFEIKKKPFHPKLKSNKIFKIQYSEYVFVFKYRLKILSSEYLCILMRMITMTYFAPNRSIVLVTWMRLKMFFNVIKSFQMLCQKLYRVHSRLMDKSVIGIMSKTLCCGLVLEVVQHFDKIWHQFFFFLMITIIPLLVFVILIPVHTIGQSNWFTVKQRIHITKQGCN